MEASKALGRINYDCSRVCVSAKAANGNGCHSDNRNQ